MIVVLIIFNQCSIKKSAPSATKNTAQSSYSASSIAEMKIYHLSNDSSQLHLKSNSKNLLFSRGAIDGPLTAHLSVQIIIKTYPEIERIDTVSYDITGSSITGDFNIYHFKNFELAEKKNYVLEVFLKDRNRNTLYRQLINVNKTDAFISENFLVNPSDSEIPLFHNFLRPSIDYEIKSQRVDLTTLACRKKIADLSLPPPPYSSSKGELPDLKEYDLFSPLTTENTILLSDPEIGDILLSNVNSEGLTYLVRPKNYPTISTVYEMVQPLRYISARKEFERLNNESSLKTGLDKFWLNCGDSKDRAKELISIYYSRVEEANVHFTSYKSGWRTDRGLIHVVFGAPSEVNREGETEVWLYGNKSDIGSVEFTFNFVANNISENHFELQRDAIYKSEWAKRVSAWRNGRIFN